MIFWNKIYFKNALNENKIVFLELRQRKKFFFEVSVSFSISESSHKTRNIDVINSNKRRLRKLLVAAVLRSAQPYKEPQVVALLRLIITPLNCIVVRKFIFLVLLLFIIIYYARNENIKLKKIFFTAIIVKCRFFF